MADKKTVKSTTKKAAVKKPVATATTAKKPVAKKAVAKKTATKKVVADVKPVVAPVVETSPCGCGCACHCEKKKCSLFGRFLKKLVVFFVIFSFGFAAAKFCPSHKRGPRAEFNNGCLVVKCPKMADMVHQMDVDHDGCVTRAEYRAARKAMKRGPRPAVETPAPDAPVAE